MPDSTSIRRPQLLLEGRYLQILSDGDSRLRVLSAGRWGYGSLMALVVMLNVFALWLCAVWVYMALFQPAPKQEQNVVALVMGIPCTAIWTAMLIAMVYSLLKMLLTRRTTIDLESGTVTLHHLPGRSHALHIEEIASVDLVLLKDKGKSTCLLGLADGFCSVHVLHWLGGYQPATAYRDELLPAARLVASFLGKPLDCSPGRFSLPRWKKGEPAERIPEDVTNHAEEQT
jgi:hypothetical protein